MYRSALLTLLVLLAFHTVSLSRTNCDDEEQRLLFKLAPATDFAILEQKLLERYDIEIFVRYRTIPWIAVCASVVRAEKILTNPAKFMEDNPEILQVQEDKEVRISNTERGRKGMSNIIAMAELVIPLALAHRKLRYDGFMCRASPPPSISV